MIKPLILVDGYDVTRWVSELSLSDSGEGREARLVFIGASWVQRGQRVDIYAVDEGGSSVPLLVRGVVDDAGDFGGEVGDGTASISCVVRDFVYFAKRVVARKPIVIASSPGRAQVAAEEKQLGEFVYYGASTCSGAVKVLLGLAGVGVFWGTIDFPITAVVVEAGQNIWGAAEELWDPLAPIIFCAHSKRQVLVLDRLWAVGAASRGVAGADISGALEGASFSGARIRQVRALRLRVR